MKMKMKKVVIEESIKAKTTKPGMLLSYSFESDLSHTSILYYYYIVTTLKYMKIGNR